jgi:predicted Zn-dependent protease with MMP-like domain
MRKIRPRCTRVKSVFHDTVAIVIVSRRRFEEMVADALDSLPRAIARQLDNVAVVTEDWPPREERDALAERDRLLLGLFRGVPRTRRSLWTTSGPDLITIYRGPLCEVATDEDDLARRVRVTVLHEIGHHFGLSDERLHELGWA